jgi:hypothetical protein
MQTDIKGDDVIRAAKGISNATMVTKVIIVTKVFVVTMRCHRACARDGIAYKQSFLKIRSKLVVRRTTDMWLHDLG